MKTDVKKVQRKLLSLVKEFDYICRTNNIDYSLHGGALLGAVRDRGFIPWDDDMDIAMSRADFNRLKKVLKGNQSFKIVGGIKKQFKAKNDSLSWVDIFICDYISEKSIPRKVKLNLLTIIDIMNRDRDSIKLSNLDKYSPLKKKVFYGVFYVGQLLPNRFKVMLYEKISMNMWLGNKTVMFRSNDQFKGRGEVFPKDWLNQYTNLKFENIDLMAIKKYEDLLVKCYGTNYMTPIKDEKNQVVHEMVRTKDIL